MGTTICRLNYFHFLTNSNLSLSIRLILKYQVKVSVKDKNSKNLKKNDQYTISVSIHSKS